MIESDIITAIQMEAQALCSDAGEFIGQVILKTDFENSEHMTYSMPLVMLDIIDGPESCQFCGGAKRVDWNFGFDVYNYLPNAYGDDVSGYSSSLMDVKTKLTNHFCLRAWLTEGMTNLENNYAFRLTWRGDHKATAIRYQDGLLKGWRVMFDSVAVDDGTDAVIFSTQTLENINPTID
jgi:hypothetical protein